MLFGNFITEGTRLRASPGGRPLDLTRSFSMRRCGSPELSASKPLQILLNSFALKSMGFTYVREQLAKWASPGLPAEAPAGPPGFDPLFLNRCPAYAKCIVVTGPG